MSNRTFFLKLVFLLFTAPIEYQNYYEREGLADTNGSAGFVGGVMKR